MAIEHGKTLLNNKYTLKKEGHSLGVGSSGREEGEGEDKGG
jgi:hypothetical protein